MTSYYHIEGLCDILQKIREDEKKSCTEPVYLIWTEH